METNPYVSDMLAREHRQQLLREAEQMRLIACSCQPVEDRGGARRVVRHTVWSFGRSLVLLGLWLERIEQRDILQYHK